MKQLLLLLLPAVALVGCMDDDDLTGPLTETDLKLNFRAEYAGRPLAIQRESYGYPTGGELKLLLFQYYVSDLELLPADGSAAVRLSEIDLIRYMSAIDNASTERNYRVPTGDYRGLRFGLGVKPALNAIDPNNFAADYVLNEAEFWNEKARYVFAKIEANADLENDGKYDAGLSYHLGNNALYSTVSFDRRFKVGSDTPEITLVADVLKALSANGQSFDIEDPARQAVHGGNQAVARDIWNRLAAQFTLELK